MDSIISLPLFPLPSVLHPAQTGQVIVYEPRFVTLFRDLQAAVPADDSGGGSSELKFGHILAPRAAPPALLQQGSVSGYPQISVCAVVKGEIIELDGRLQINYQGQRRCKLLTVDEEAHPYPLAAATWLDDDAASSQQQEQLTEQLEQDVFRLLQQVAKYSRLLDSSAPGLPSSLLMYAPPPPQKQSVAEYMKKAGMPAGDQIATWMRSGSAYSSDNSNKKKPLQDPYQLMRDQLGKERRQELFSFAAASLLELGMVERLALLQCRDTAARLQFVATAVQPFLQDLLARLSVKQAISP